jgi:flavin-dependent dehydrogenase
VAGLSLRPQRAEDRAECCIGDALTMIPPVTGNGMSMAFESAQIAVEPVAAYCRGELTWTEARLTVARACDGAFGKRLRWAGWLQGMMFAPACQRGLERAVLGSKLVWRVMFAQTR